MHLDAQNTRRGKRSRLTQDQQAELLALYNQGDLTYFEIGRRFGVSGALVSYYARTREQPPRGLQCKTRSAARKCGANHPMWAGGKKMSHGYVLLHRPEHPNRSKAGYVAEHRLVMEAHLRANAPWHPALDADGYLRRDWQVHHRDHRKANNCLENLVPAIGSLHTAYHRATDRAAAEMYARILELEALLRLHHLPTHPAVVSTPDSFTKNVEEAPPAVLR